jgi:uncharacterized protein (UPF0332 family)
VSPRSEEFLAEARKALREAELLVAEGMTAGSVSRAYYAMLYAARAALSEKDRYAKTHRGTWALFRELFVEPREFDEELFAQAQRAQRIREEADYDAAGASQQDAEAMVEQASRFVEATAAMLAG